MRFLPILAPFLAATAFAVPGHYGELSERSADGTFVTARDTSQISELARTLEYASRAQGCGWKCVGMLIHIPCLVETLGAGEFTKVSECAPLKTVSISVWWL